MNSPTAGIKCPKCETLLHDVVQTKHQDGSVIRWRLCFNGHRFKTAERPIAYRTIKKGVP